MPGATRSLPPNPKMSRLSFLSCGNDELPFSFVVLFILSAVLFLLLYSYPTSADTTETKPKIGFSMEDVYFSYDLPWKNYGLSLSGALGDGFSATTSYQSFSFFDDNLELNPFVRWTSKIDKVNRVQGGVKGSYLSYKLGAWLVRSDFALLGGADSYEVRGTLDFSFGRIRSVANLHLLSNSLGQYGDYFSLNSPWEATLSGSFLGTGNSDLKLGTISLARQLELKGHKLTLEGGLGFPQSSSELGLSPTAGIKVASQGFFLFFDGFYPYSALLSLEGESSSLKLLVKPEKETYTLLLGHKGFFSGWIEVSNRPAQTARISYFVEVSWQ